MSHFKFRGVRLLLVFVFIGAVVAQAQVPPGWSVAGSSPQDYDFSLDSSTPPNGRSALIAAKPGVSLRGFGTLMQLISAENYHGQHVRLSGYLKTEDATRAQLWMRVDGPDRKVLSFDNMDSRPITGTSDWGRYEIVLDVPTDSVDIAFGFLLIQGGKVWGHDFGLEKVDAAVPATASAAPELPKGPVNMDFQTSASTASAGSTSYNADRVDVSDFYRQEGYYFPRDPPARIGPPDTSGGPFHNDKYNLCGMGIVAETKDSAGTTLRWNLRLSVFLDGNGRSASIAAGAFKLQEHGGKPTPRPAITRLTVQLRGEKDLPAEVRIHGTPNAENGVMGEFPEAYAEKLFNAFDAGTPFTLNLTYDSGEHESIRARADGSHRSRFYHGSDAPTERCLRALAPATESGLKNPLIDLWHPD